MALFGFGKDKKDGTSSSDLVLAYLEDAQRVRAPFTLAGPRRAEVSAVLQGLDEAEGTATFQVNGALLADKGQVIDLLFIQEGLRIGGSARLQEVRSGLAILELPESLELRERRKTPRARLNAKEGATCTALTGLFEGVGITGILENISETGARVRVEKAISIKGEKRLPLGTSLVPDGQPFMLIKLNKVPKCPAVMELEGQAAYLESGPAGLCMGIRFSSLKPDVSAALKGMVASRASAVPSSLPPKNRRKAEAQAPGLLAEEPLVAPSRTPARPPEPVEPRLSAPAGAKAERPAEEAAKAEPPAAPRPPEEEAPAAKTDSLLRLKKRSRAVVVLSRTAAFSEILKDFLQDDGYGRVLATTFPDEVFELLRQPNLGALFLDGEMSVTEAMEYLQKLRSAFPDLPPVVLAAEDISAAVVMAARRHGIAQLVVRPYALDAAFSTLLAELIAR